MPFLITGVTDKRMFLNSTSLRTEGGSRSSSLKIDHLDGIRILHVSVVHTITRSVERPACRPRSANRALEVPTQLFFSDEAFRQVLLGSFGAFELSWEELFGCVTNNALAFTQPSAMLTYALSESETGSANFAEPLPLQFGCKVLVCGVL